MYKVLNDDMTPCHGGTGKWTPGEWMPFIKELEPCFSGYHLCRREDVIYWLGPSIWTAEYKGEMVKEEDKIVVQQARIVKHLDTWNERTARLFACDCTERAFSRIGNPDPRSVNAIAVARRYANGQATSEELSAASAAANAAVYDAASAAANAAVYDAASAAANDAVYDAASAATWAADRAAAWAATWAAERKWQTERLFEYLEV